jgi:hypothetical protein
MDIEGSLTPDAVISVEDDALTLGSNFSTPTSEPATLEIRPVLLSPFEQDLVDAVPVSCLNDPCSLDEKRLL